MATSGTVGLLGSTRKDHAQTYLDERMKDYTMDLGHVRLEQVTFTELAEDLKTDSRIQGRKSLERVEISINHLEKVFSNMRAMEINTARVKRCIDQRQAAEKIGSYHEALVTPQVTPKVVNLQEASQERE